MAATAMAARAPGKGASTPSSRVSGSRVIPPHRMTAHAWVIVEKNFRQPLKCRESSPSRVAVRFLLLRELLNWGALRPAGREAWLTWNAGFPAICLLLGD